MKDRELRKRLQVLERDRRFGGWRGGGGRSLDGLIAVMSATDAPPNHWHLCKQEEWSDGGLLFPFANINEDNMPIVSYEARMYCAFGRSSAGKSVASYYDYDAMVLMLRAEQAVGAWTYIDDAPASLPLLYYAPMFVFAYPILEEWDVPIDADYPNHIVPWAAQPRTTFSDNLLNGALSGHINPATGKIDNYLAMCHSNQIEMPTAAYFTIIGAPSFPILFLQTAYAGHNCDPDGIEQTIGGVDSYAPKPDFIIPHEHVGVRNHVLRTNITPEEPIYGVMLCLCTLGDMQALRLTTPFTRNQTICLDPNWAAASRSAHCAQLEIKNAADATAGFGPFAQIHLDDERRDAIFFGIEDADVIDSISDRKYRKLCTVGLSNAGDYKLASLNILRPPE